MKGKDLYYLVGGVIIAIVLMRACNQCNRLTKPTIVTKIDTVVKYVEVKGDTQYVPEIIGVTNTIHVPKYVHDTVTNFEVRIDPADTAAILQRYFQIVNYSDTQKIKDYGHIIIQDSVTENRIKNRRLITNLLIPEKTITITKQVKRTVGYFGVSGMGNQDEIVYAVGLDLGLKFKSDFYIGVGANFLKGGEMFYEGQFKFPIRLKRK